MFSTLAKGNLFYILDKNKNLDLKIGKVVDIINNGQLYNFAPQELDIAVDVNGETYTFKKVPSNLSIASPSTGVVISDNREDMFNEVENSVKISHQIIDSIPYHKAIISSSDNILSKLNPKFAKEKEQEEKISSLETRMGGIEQGIGNIKEMLNQVLNKQV